MAYTPTNWQNGDVITAERLNKLEGGVVDGQNGWSIGVQKSTYLDNSITTSSYQGMNVAQLTDIPTDSTFIVTMGGHEYVAERVTDSYDNWIYYGAPIIGDYQIDWTEYPFCIVVTNNVTNAGMFATESAGTYAVKIETVTKTVEVSDDFILAVAEAVNAINGSGGDS